MTKFLTIKSPSDWIKNSAAAFPSAHPHRVAVNILDEDNHEILLTAKNFTLESNGQPITEETMQEIESMFYEMIQEMKTAKPNAAKVSVMVLHNDMRVAHQILSAAIDIPFLLELETVVAIETDGDNWNDVFLTRTGEVEKGTTTTFEAYAAFGEVSVEHRVPDHSA